jgi:hypothetical protein
VTRQKRSERGGRRGLRGGRRGLRGGRRGLREEEEEVNVRRQKRSG